jgi:hypothetical protein
MNSTRTMASFTTIPANMIIPSHPGMDRGKLARSIPRATPMAANGTLSRMITAELLTYRYQGYVLVK